MITGTEAAYLTGTGTQNRTGTANRTGRTGGSRAASGTSFRSAVKQAESSGLDSIFTEASEKTGVPESLLKAVAKAESGFNPNARSGAGALGIMQLMPGTAKTHGVTNPFDARQNIMAGAEILAGGLKQYHGDISLTLAAYNAGAGNVKKYGGVPPFKETRNYISRIMGYLRDGGVDVSDGRIHADAGNGNFGSVGSDGLNNGLNNGELSNTYGYDWSGSGTGDSSVLSALFDNLDESEKKELASDMVSLLRMQMMMSAESTLGNIGNLGTEEEI